jgi:hypothetical protein
MSKIITSTELIYDFKLYLLECFTRFFGNHLKDTNINELKQTVNFAFDKLVNYENLNNRKILSINYDISAWLDDPAKLPLEEFRVLEPIKYVFELDDYILSSLEKVKGFSNDLTETVYRLRTNEMGPTGDKIFCYKRTPLSAQVIESIKISKREASRRHVELAERSV